MKINQLNRDNYKFSNFTYFSYLIGLIFRNPTKAINIIRENKNSNLFYILKISSILGIYSIFYSTIFILIIYLFIYLLNLKDILHLSNIVKGLTSGFFAIIAISLTRTITKTIFEKILKLSIIGFSIGFSEAIITGLHEGILLGLIIGIIVGTVKYSFVSNKKGISLMIAIGISFLILGTIKEDFIYGILSGIIYAINYGIIYRIIYNYKEGVSVGIIIGIIYGIIYGIISGINPDIHSSVYLSTSAIVMSILVWIGIGKVFGICEGILTGLFLGLLYGLTIMFDNNNTINGILFIVVYIVLLFKLFYYPFSILYLFGFYNGKGYKFHPLYWDKVCIIPFPFLDKILYSFYEYSKTEGSKEIDKIIKENPYQKMSALKSITKIIFDTAKSENDLTKVKDIINNLPEGSKGFLKETKDIKNIVNEISIRQLKIKNSISDKIKEDRIIELIRLIRNSNSTVKGYNYPINILFRNTSDLWLKNAEKQLESIKIDVFATKTLQVFQASESIKRNKYAFMRRDTVINEIVNNINLGCNGMLLYGRRRIGKTTVLYNLDIFLSTDTYNIIYISMQNARYNTSLENNFIPNLITKLEIFVSDFPNKTKNTLEYFYDVLSLCNKNLIYNNKYIIICIDEYEGINENMINGTFNVNLLTTIRESIKNHSNIFWLFSGSNRLSELKTIQWTSYFISFKTVEILPFTFIETKYLLTQPFKYADSENLKNTKINVWDKGSIEKIYEETNGWPYFVQAIAHAAIEILKSDQARSKVDLYILENAFRKVIQSSYNSFERLLKNECEIKGEWEYILEFTNSDLQLKPSNPLIRESLKRRLIIKEVDNMWKINMPLMERWLKMYY